MRRPVKPFVTEYRGGRKSAQAASAAYDPSDHFSSDERPPRDVNEEPEPEDSYEAAMRAADALFEQKASPVGDKIEDRNRTQQPDGYGSSAVINAEAFFKKVDPQPDVDQPTVSSQSAENPARNILADTSYKDPLEERLRAASLIRRGRKPGSKNKPKEAQLEFQDDAPKHQDDGPKRRGRKPGSKNKPKVYDSHIMFHPGAPEAARPEAEPEQEIMVAAAPVAAAPSEPKRRGRKPGSKNKPKIAAPIPAASLAHTAPVAPRPMPQLRRDVATRTVAPVRSSTAGYLAARGKTILKPGEKWKRRLRFV